MSLLSEWNRLKLQLEKQDNVVLQRLFNAYGETYTRIDQDIAALIELMTVQLESGKISKESISKSVVYKKLISNIEHEINNYSSWVKVEISTAANDSAKQGLSAGKFLLLVALADSLGVAVSDLPRDMVNSAPSTALDFLKGYLDPNGKLFEKINGLSKYHGQEIADGILERVSEGMNPINIATWITDAYGVPLVDSLRNMRTAQLYAYRDANFEVMKSNSDLLEGWIWSAELDDVCCVVCVSEHGTVHQLDETMDSHFNCRCAPLPWVKGMDNPVGQTGEDWLNNQDKSMQQQILGAKFDGWSKGDFTLQDMIGNYESESFGNMLVEKPLKDLL